MGNRDIVGFGTSAGGVEALLFLVKHFPRDFPAAILVTLHISNRFRSGLDELLTRAGPLPAKFAEDGEALQKGKIYIAPPDRHLLLDGEQLALGSGSRENNARPAIDPMLRSVALCCGSRSVGIILTGTLGDGASGLWALSQTGGITVIQDPRDVAFPEMPVTAMSLVKADYVSSLADMPSLLTKLVHEPSGAAHPVPLNLKFEVETARNGLRDMGKIKRMDALGRRSVLACPDCGGVMWEIEEGDMSRYRCHVGHASSAETMAIAIDENLRRALASAQRALEERLSLLRKLYSQAKTRNHRMLVQTWEEKYREAEKEMDVIASTIRDMHGAAESAA